MVPQSRYELASPYWLASFSLSSTVKRRPRKGVARIRAYRSSGELTNQGRDEMMKPTRTLTAGGGSMLLWVFILVGLQGCRHDIYLHRTVDKMVADDRGPVVPAGPDDCGAKGCDPADYTGTALGFIGIGGASPVTNNQYTCNAGSIKCGNNSSGCSLRYPNKVCTTTFTYPSSGYSGPCACQCLNPPPPAP